MSGRNWKFGRNPHCFLIGVGWFRQAGLTPLTHVYLGSCLLTIRGKR